MKNNTIKKTLIFIIILTAMICTTIITVAMTPNMDIDYAKHLHCEYPPANEKHLIEITYSYKLNEEFLNAQIENQEFAIEPFSNSAGVRIVNYQEITSMLVYGRNRNGSCGMVSMAVLLQYYNNMHDLRVIPEHLDYRANGTPNQDVAEKLKDYLMDKTPRLLPPGIGNLIGGPNATTHNQQLAGFRNYFEHFWPGSVSSGAVSLRGRYNIRINKLASRSQTIAC